MKHLNAHTVCKLNIWNTGENVTVTKVDSIAVRKYRYPLFNNLYSRFFLHTYGKLLTEIARLPPLDAIQPSQIR